MNNQAAGDFVMHVVIYIIIIIFFFFRLGVCLLSRFIIGKGASQNRPCGRRKTNKNRFSSRLQREPDLIQVYCVCLRVCLHI